MPNRKYVIKLDESERSRLGKITKSGVHAARTIMRANIILLLDLEYSVRQIAERLQTTTTTVQNVKTEFCEVGLEATLKRKERSTPPVAAKIDGDFESHLIALCCSEPPEGYARWSVRLLADKVIELGYIDSVSPMTICRTLKKMNFSLT